MSGMSGWTRGLMVAGAALTVTACASYPTEPRYSTRADTPHAVANVPPAPNAPIYPGQPGQPYPGAVVSNEAPPPARAPIESIDGGGLPPAAVTSSLNGGPATAPTRPSQPSNNYPGSTLPEPNDSPPSYNPPGTPRAPVTGGAVAYVIQPGDTISGVGRRFQTPVQSLIDLNNLGPRAAITSGQRIVLPDNAVDTGPDPYATGPAPVGVTVPRAGAVPPPPTPPAGNAALPPGRPPVTPVPTGPIRPPAQTPAQAPLSTAPSAPVAGNIGLQWPVRGDIVRRFGPVSMGERNNGINIGASAGAPVTASAAGRVAYVGDALVGQGLTVLIVHRDGWRTVYGHLGSATVEDGADVRAGQQIGTVGLTAGDGRPSMHFETRRMQGDEPVAIDPLTVLPR